MSTVPTGNLLTYLYQIPDAMFCHDLSKTHPNVGTVLLEGSGHALLSECPEEVLDALIRIV